MSAEMSLDSRVSAIRTVALVGPAAAGKTLLLDALLAYAGAIPQAGSIERGSTVSDHDPLEKRLGHSLQSSLAHFTHGGIRVHAIDTPGAPDFVGQALPALEAADTAIVVINALNGIELMAQRLLTAAGERGLTRLIVVNKIDCPDADLAGLLTQAARGLRQGGCLPLNLPADGARRVADCFFAASGEADFSSVADAHRALVEQVVEVDAAFVDRYLTDGDVDPRELHAPLEQALREGHLIPVCFCSAKTGAGIGELLAAIEHLMPNPAEGTHPPFLEGKGTEPSPYPARPDPAAHALAHVFKIVADPYLGKMGVMRVHQGRVVRGRQLFVGMRASPSAWATSSCCRAPGMWTWTKPCPATSAPSQGGRPHLRRRAARRPGGRAHLPEGPGFPHARARPGHQPRAPRRRAKALGGAGAAGGRRPLPAHRAGR